MSNAKKHTIGSEKPTSDIEMLEKRLKDTTQSYQEKATEYNKLVKEMAALQTERDFYKNSVDELALFTADEKARLEELHLNGNVDAYSRELLSLRQAAYNRLEERKNEAIAQTAQKLAREKLENDKATITRLGIDIGDIPYSVVMAAENGQLDLLDWAKDKLASQKTPDSLKEPDLNSVGNHAARMPSSNNAPDMNAYFDSLL